MTSRCEGIPSPVADGSSDSLCRTANKVIFQYIGSSSFHIFGMLVLSDIHDILL